jgi:hypothetical protein
MRFSAVTAPDTRIEVRAVKDCALVEKRFYEIMRSIAA